MARHRNKALAARSPWWYILNLYVSIAFVAVVFPTYAHKARLHDLLFSFLFFLSPPSARFPLYLYFLSALYETKNANGFDVTYRMLEHNVGYGSLVWQCGRKNRWDTVHKAPLGSRGAEGDTSGDSRSSCCCGSDPRVKR